MREVNCFRLSKIRILLCINNGEYEFLFFDPQAKCQKKIGLRLGECVWPLSSQSRGGIRVGRYGIRLEERLSFSSFLPSPSLGQTFTAQPELQLFH